MVLMPGSGGQWTMRQLAYPPRGHRGGGEGKTALRLRVSRSGLLRMRAWDHQVRPACPASAALRCHGRLGASLVLCRLCRSPGLSLGLGR